MSFPLFFSISRCLVVLCMLPSFGDCGVMFERLSCVSLRPVGANMTEPGPNPFNVTASPPPYTPGTPIQITINAANGETFQGIILQGRVDGSQTPIGSFNTPGGFTSLDCGGDDRATLIDDGSISIRSFPQVFQWVPPNFIVGRRIWIYIAIVVRPGFFWWMKIYIDVSFQIECNPEMCRNGGTCEIVPPDNEIYCMCPPPFTGPLCTDCMTTSCDDSDICPSGTFCTPVSCTGCRCNSITSGFCSTCGKEPCLNGGYCIHDMFLPKSFRCECPKGFGGEICDTAVIQTEQDEYNLTNELSTQVTDGRVSYLSFDVSNNGKPIKVRIVAIRGLEYFHGKGMPGQNPRKRGLSLLLDVEPEERVTFWFCLKAIDNETEFRLSILELQTQNHVIPNSELRHNYTLPQNLMNMINARVLCCLVCTVNLDTKVAINNIQGYDYYYGTGEPIQNKQIPNMPLYVNAGDSFWFCLELINPAVPNPIFLLDLFINLDLPLFLPPLFGPPMSPLPYELPTDIQNLVDDGNKYCLIFNVMALSKVRLNIQGYDFSYGYGDPKVNPRQPNLPLIVDAGDRFWICLRRLLDLEVASFQLDNRNLVTQNHVIPNNDLRPNYNLPMDLINMINERELCCVVCTVNLDTKVAINNIQGYDYYYGTGEPIQNKQIPNMPLFVNAGDSFWFCLELINPAVPNPIFLLDLFINLNLQPPLPLPGLPFQLPVDIQNLVDDGNEHCLVFNVTALSKVRLNIQGYDFSYGIGDPRENPRQPNLPLIVDAGDRFWICLRRLFGLGVTSFQLDNRNLVVNDNHQVGDLRPQPNYQLPSNLLNMITDGTIDCIVCTVNVPTLVDVNFNLGFDIYYGTGVPIQNKQNNGPLIVAAGGTFWFCLEPINPPFFLILNLQ